MEIYLNRGNDTETPECASDGQSRCRAVVPAAAMVERSRRVTRLC